MPDFDFETDDGFMLLLGLVLVVGVATTYNLLTFKILENNLEPFAPWLVVGGLVIAYFYSEREMGDLDDYEVVFLAVALGATFLYKYSVAFQDVISNFQPYSGITIMLVTVGAFYALSTNMSLTSTVMEMIVGATLVITAMVQFDISTVKILSDSLRQFALWIYIIALALAYMIADRDLGDLSNGEIAAFSLGIIPFAAYEFSSQFRTTVQNNNPELGVILTAFVAVAFLVIKNNGMLFEL